MVRALYWFRTDLRLHDSPALNAALQLEPECLLPVWTWDPHYVLHARVGVNRWQFLLDSQRVLSEHLTRLNPRQKLLVVRGKPVKVLEALVKRCKITHLIFEKDTDTYARSRDQEVIKAMRDVGVEVIVRSGRTLWDPDDMIRVHGQEVPKTVNSVKSASEKLGPPPRPFKTPQSLPDPVDIGEDFDILMDEAGGDMNAQQRKDRLRSYDRACGPQGDFSPPTFEELGLKDATSPHRGGEERALRQLEEYTNDARRTATFSKPLTAPTTFLPPATTCLSAHLHFGCLGIRQFYWRIKDVVKEFDGAASSFPTNLEGQLLFREMYFCAQAGWKNYEQMEGNDNCRQFDWSLRNKYDEAGKCIGVHEDEEAQRWFEAWKWGRTGFPWIDALMRQLRQDGFIHHLGRHSVACFLTRGQCYISWERGQEVFEEWLIDHEPACNTGNWQWLSCSQFFHQYLRVYSPEVFPKKYDPTGALVRHYVPELARFPDKYIYAPHKAPILDQKAAGCRIGEDYPRPLFDANVRKSICVGKVAEAFKSAKRKRGD